jgi:multiple sugar transport system permease protein
VTTYRIGAHKGARPVLRQVVLNGAGLLAVGVLVFPVYWALCFALEPGSSFYGSPSLLPLHIIWSNFRQAIQADGGNIITSIVIALSVAALGVGVALPTAYGLKRFRVRYGAVVVMMMLIAQMVPAITLSLSFYSVYSRLHLLNSFPGLILADSTYAIPLMVVLLRAYMVSLPDELLDAARIDGCGELRTLMSVVVPLMLPGIITAGLFGFLGAWGDFIFAVTLNASGAEPVTVGLYKFVGTYTTSWGPIMATVILAAIPAAIVLAVAQRWVRGGLRVGAIRG